ncbi:MAG: ZPR1 zinc finger domain-containing protein [Candidatus Thermoplasmatota archaeon]|nr:ZPR1 zinc finger domain-containing protein [Candidatus Thermoplasmatota archaeon]MEE3315961.1 ZPR1 zinc finger domain-containing protein [Candidatus Thermoplasmatota archaeon]
MESTIGIPCQQCSTEGITMLTSSSEIPYFGEYTQITLCCDNCGWKHTDFIPSEGVLPGFWSLEIDESDKLDARVVRSSSCTVRIPEVEIEVFPGSSSSGFITNIEGLINRFIDAIGTIVRGANGDPDDDGEEEALALLEKLDNVKSGLESVTIELLDPRGRSQIVHDQADRRELEQDESDALQIGFDVPITEQP